MSFALLKPPVGDTNLAEQPSPVRWIAGASRHSHHIMSPGSTGTVVPWEIIIAANQLVQGDGIGCFFLFFFRWWIFILGRHISVQSKCMSSVDSTEHVNIVFAGNNVPNRITEQNCVDGCSFRSGIWQLCVLLFWGCQCWALGSLEWWSVSQRWLFMI